MKSDSLHIILKSHIQNIFWTYIQRSFLSLPPPHSSQSSFSQSEIQNVLSILKQKNKIKLGKNDIQKSLASK